MKKLQSMSGKTKAWMWESVAGIRRLSFLKYTIHDAFYVNDHTDFHPEPHELRAQN